MFFWKAYWVSEHTDFICLLPKVFCGVRTPITGGATWGQARSFDREILVPFFEFYGPLETFLGWTTLHNFHTGFFMDISILVLS